MRKKKVNPCQMKGRYGGKRASGRRYPHSIFVSACECKYAFISIRPLDFPALQYAMPTKPGEDQGKTVPLSTAKGLLCTVPCQETFRHKKSKGTRAYKKIFQANTQFRGCQPLEEDLVQEKFIRHDVKETIGLPQATDNVSDGDDEYHVPDSGGILRTQTSLAKFFYKIAAQEVNSLKDKPIRPPAPNFGGEELDMAAIDLKHRHLMNLYQSGNFDEEEGATKEKNVEKKKMKLVAELLIQGLSDEGSITKIAPHIPYPEFLTTQGKVYRLVEDTLPETTKKFLKIWNEVLTAYQKKALDLVLMNNDEKKTKEEIAKNLDITVDSLNDRLRGANKSLKELLPQGESAERPKEKTKGLYKPIDAQYDGFYYRSEAKKVHPLFEIKDGIRIMRDVATNPLPPTKKRKGVNPAKIRAWAREYRVF